MDQDPLRARGPDRAEGRAGQHPERGEQRQLHGESHGGRGPGVRRRQVSHGAEAAHGYIWQVIKPKTKSHGDEKTT